MPAQQATITTNRQIAVGRRRGARQHFALPMPSRCGWTIATLADLRDLMISFRGDLVEVAAAMNETPARCDLALNALLGRTPAEAITALNARRR